MKWRKMTLPILLIFLFTLSCGIVLAENPTKSRQYYEQQGKVLWDVDAKKKVIALTFDDGPHPTYTPEILDVLAKYDAKATFFIVGEMARKYPNIVLREVREGHEIANHTYTHTYQADLQTLEQEVLKTKELLRRITGFSPALFRPVGGEYNDGVIDIAIRSQHQLVLWSWHQDTEDWKRPGVEKIVDKVLSGAEPGDIILFHDGGGERKQTVAALDKIVAELKQDGYVFVTVSELINEYAREQSEPLK